MSCGRHAMADYHPTVLVIEDEAPIRRFLRATLTANGYQLIEATTAQEGWCRPRRVSPDRHSRPGAPRP